MTVEEKVKELLGKMTLAEKVGQMIQIPYSVAGREESLRWARLGAGSFLHVLGDDARELQKEALNTRLGIPVLFGIDAIHGHGLNKNATIFPTQLAMASSWDTQALRRAGRITAKEVATDGLHWTFSPVLCLGRDTRWGRVNETFGEDPFLSGELGAAIIKGYQGESLDAPDSILACAKHYIGYGEAVGGRDSCDTEMTFRKMRETFLPPFKKAVEAGCATFMTAYGSIDGTPFTACPKALREILRGELGFDGFVVTDWDNVNSLVTNQHVAADIKEASKMAAVAGNDMIMTSSDFYDSVIWLVENKLLDESVVDEAASNILRIKFRMNLFEHPEKKGIPGCIGCDEHLQINREIAKESVVLLQNNGVLPIKAGTKIAVVGPNADDIQAQYGDWTYFTHPEPDKTRTPMRPFVTVLEGLRQQFGKDNVTYSKGCNVLPSDDDNIAEAVETAKESDVIVFVPGDMIDQVGEYKDRANLELSGRQLELFNELTRLNIPVITVLVASKPLCIPEIAAAADGLIVAFNGGMYGGEAVASIIAGETNPCGRLPISFPVHSGQVPVYYNQLPGWHGGKYMDMPARPLFVFGEGLSYTTFKYTDLVVSDDLNVSVTVENTGDRDGYEVVQVYYKDVVSSVLTPVKQLVGFTRVFLKSGEKQEIKFEFNKTDFALVNSAEEYVTEPGEFILMAGHSSKDEELITQTFVI